jgi:hypothetical protein
MGILAQVDATKGKQIATHVASLATRNNVESTLGVISMVIVPARQLHMVVDNIRCS